MKHVDDEGDEEGEFFVQFLLLLKQLVDPTTLNVVSLVVEDSGLRSNLSRILR